MRCTVWVDSEPVAVECPGNVDIDEALDGLNSRAEATCHGPLLSAANQSLVSPDLRVYAVWAAANAHKRNKKRVITAAAPCLRSSASAETSLSSRVRESASRLVSPGAYAILKSSCERKRDQRATQMTQKMKGKLTDRERVGLITCWYREIVNHSNLKDDKGGVRANSHWVCWSNQGQPPPGYTWTTWKTK